MGEIAGRMGTATPEDEQPVVLPSEFEQHVGVQPDEDVARWLRRHYPCGVAVVTAAVDGAYFGVTVSAFSFISLDPLLVLIALGNESQTGEQIQHSRSFGASMLTNRQRFLADRFAGRAPLVDRKFADVPHLTASTGSPLLAECISWLDCSLERTIPGGDHMVYVGRAVMVGHGIGDEADPLLYFDSSYRGIV
jgi:flavin reductase (DIM6/NTAB) family NADH-FMN oxidoreductase RutF